MMILARRLCNGASLLGKVQHKKPIQKLPALWNGVRLFSADSAISEAETNAKKYEFKAETRKLLDIVANSLYSEKEVFCRELVSNAADAMEKLRHEQLSKPENFVSSPPSDIKIVIDKHAKTLCIQDSGIGMTESEMVEYLGTIARSGSKKFVESLSSSEATSSSDSKVGNIIGQFGVGFYSAFMVGDKLTVISKSARVDSHSATMFESDGLGSYEISTVPSVDFEFGTKIIIHLKEDCSEYLDPVKIKELVKKYSNFVGFPIILENETINSIQPIWHKDSGSISDDDHKEFFRYLSRGFGDFQYKLNFKTDAPIQINSLLYVPSINTETIGSGRIESNVSLYSRKVMIQSKTGKIFPEYLRFLHGVVESDDVPMNLSREMIQNSPILKKLGDIMTGKVLKWLQDEAKRDASKFESFFKNFGIFIKEGVCTSDTKSETELAKLLRFESSATNPGSLTSLSEYLERRKDPNDKIYYLFSSNRQWAEESPYFEQFKEKGQEVLFLLDQMDEFVAERLSDFQGVELCNIESSDAISKSSKSDDSSKVEPNDNQSIVEWFKSTLGGSISEAKISERNLSFPVIVTDHLSPTVRRLMKMSPTTKDLADNMPQKIEINHSHPVIVNLKNAITDGRTELAKDVTWQLYDNALIAAGVKDDPRGMLKRLNKILETALDNSKK